MNTSLVIRPAEQQDLPGLIAMLMDDELGKLREDASTPVHACYRDAFANIEQDPNNELVVLEREQHIAGMLQCSFIPYLTHRGSWRCLIEGVRIRQDLRGLGLGRALMQWAIERAVHRKCAIVQLTSDKRRHEAARFYESLGFEATHQGFKLRLNDQ